MQKQLLTGNPVLSMLRFSLPIFFGSILIQALSFLDSLLLARMAGVTAFASVSASGAALMPVMGLAMGISAGSVIPLAISCGGGKPDDIRSCAAGARALVGVASALLLVLSEIMAYPLLRLTGTPEDILPGAARFCRVALLALPFSAHSGLNAGILRATGNARAAARYQVLAGAINLPLDAVFLALGAGEAGVAAGSVIAQAISALLSRRAVAAHPLFAEPERAKKSDLIRSLKTALPVCLQFSMGSLSGMAFQSMVNARGSLAVATVAAAERTLGAFSLPARTTMGAVEVFSGQNRGADRIDRARQGVRHMALALFGFGVLAALAAYLFGEDFARTFVPSASPLLAVYLRVNALFLPFEFVSGALRNALQGLGHPGRAALAGAFDLAARIMIALFARNSFKMLLLIQPIGITLTLAALLALYFPLILDLSPSGTGDLPRSDRRIRSAPARAPRPGTPA